MAGGGDADGPAEEGQRGVDLNGRRGTWTGMLLVWLCVSAVDAFGQVHPDARVTEVEVNSYRLAPSGLVPGSVGTAEVLGHLELYMTAVGFHLVRPMVIVSANGDPIRALVSQRQQLNLSLAFGLVDWIELGVTVPWVVDQIGELPGQGLGRIVDSGFGDTLVTCSRCSWMENNIRWHWH